MSNKMAKSRTSIVNPCPKLFKDRNETGDVKFIVDSEEIWAHRNVLAALSPKFKAQFYGSLPDTGDIKVDDVSAAAFNEFLKYFYAKEVELTSDNIEDVFSLAKQSLVDELVNDCMVFLLGSVASDTLSIYLRLVQLYSLDELQERCNYFINRNIKKVFESSDFLNYDRDTLVHILSLKKSKCKEIKVFEACMKWAREECKRNGVDGTKMENVRKALGDAFYRIRFNSMTFKEFAKIRNFHRNLFTLAESNEISFNLIGIKDKKWHLDYRRTQHQPLFAPQTGLSCNIFKDAGDHFVLNNSYSDLVFCCNKTIKLNGFVMGAVDIPFDNLIVYTSSTFQNYPKTVQKWYEEFKVIFDTPFKIESNQKLFVRISFLERHPQLFGYFLLDETKVSGVKFEFHTGNSRKVISQLLFDVDEED